MKNINYLCGMLAIAAAFATLPSCEKNEEPAKGSVSIEKEGATMPETATLTGKTLLIDGKGGVVTIPMSCGIEGAEATYTVSVADAAWCEASVEGATLTLDIKASGEKKPREAVVSISATASKAVIEPMELKVKQGEKIIPQGNVAFNTKDAQLSEGASIAEDGSVSLPYFGGEVSVPLANTLEDQNIAVNYTLETMTAEWLTVKVEDGKIVITADASANASGDIAVAVVAAEGASEETAIEAANIKISREAFKSAVPMAFVKGGTFVYGKGKMLDTETNKPIEKSKDYAHDVTLSSFYIATTETTQKLYTEIMGTNPTGKDYIGDDKPVVNIKWTMAAEFCNELSKKEGLDTAYVKGEIILISDGWSYDKFQDYTVNKSANGYRLPTSAEWEFAAKGGNTGNVTAFSGSDVLDEVAWNGDNAKNGSKYVLSDVAKKKANALGIYDMCGNAEEWCFDWSYKDSYDRSAAETDPVGPVYGESEKSGFSMKIGRGGSLDSSFYNLYIINERSLDPIYYTSLRGFRVVRNVK